MDGRFEARREELLAQACVSVKDWEAVVARLEAFVEPFVGSLTEAAQRRHVVEYSSGLLSSLDRKTGEGIAYLHGQDRKPMQPFVGESPWEHTPLLTELSRQVAARIGEADGVIVFDPLSFRSQTGLCEEGDEVGRRRAAMERAATDGRQGKIDNCQVGIDRGYVSRQEQALVNVRLSLPEEWTKDRTRCRAAGVPKHVKFQTRHAQALAMLDESGPLLPHGWIADDDETGRCGPFREALRARDERYLLAVPSNTLIRDSEVPPPEYSGHGRHPKVPWQRVDAWCASQPESAWTRLDVRDGEKGPLVIDALKRRVQARTPTGGTGPDEVLFITRERQSEGTLKHDDHLSNADPTMSLIEFARTAKSEHRIEECFQRGKSEAGLGDDQVRNGIGWHHHQTLSLIAAWFLNEQTRRGKHPDPRADGSTSPPSDRRPNRTPTPSQHSRAHHRYRPTPAPTKRTRPSLTLRNT